MKGVGPNTPIQYVMGKTEFCGLDFAVDERVLIPRPETEMLVETVIEILDESGLAEGRKAPLRILDLGTGSGCIAVSLAVKLTKRGTECRIFASDLSSGALEVAGANAKRHGVSDRIEFIQSDLFDDIRGRYDIIVSNPPYVSRREFPELQKEVLKEPVMAFDGGQDGLDMYRRIAGRAHEFLTEGGYIAMEMGFGQRKAIAGMLEAAGSFRVVSEKRDYNDIERVIVARWKNY